MQDITTWKNVSKHHHHCRYTYAMDNWVFHSDSLGSHYFEWLKVGKCKVPMNEFSHLTIKFETV